MQPQAGLGGSQTTIMGGRCGTGPALDTPVMLKTIFPPWDMGIVFVIWTPPEPWGYPADILVPSLALSHRVLILKEKILGLLSSGNSPIIAACDSPSLPPCLSLACPSLPLRLHLGPLLQEDPWAHPS
jgi:hypothetical protein